MILLIKTAKETGTRRFRINTDNVVSYWLDDNEKILYFSMSNGETLRYHVKNGIETLTKLDRMLSMQKLEYERHTPVLEDGDNNDR